MMMMMMVVGRVMRMMMHGRSGADLVTQYPRDAGHRRYVVLVADAVGQQPIPNLPREDARVLELQLLDVLHDFRRGNARLAAADCARQDAAGLVVPR